MIIRFHSDLANTNFKTRFEGLDAKGKITMYRLVEGSEEVEEKKQDKEAKQKTFKTGPTNTVVDGQAIYQTEITDQAVLNFLNATTYWKDGRIVEYDPLAENKKIEEILVRDAEIVAKVANISEKDELVKYGYYLFGKSTLTKAAQDDYSGIKADLIKYTYQNPEEMIKVLDKNNKQVAEHMQAALAFAKGILVESEGGKSISWAETKVRVVSVVVGQKPLDALIDFYGTTEGKEVKQLVGQKIVESAADTVASTAKTNITK